MHAHFRLDMFAFRGTDDLKVAIRFEQGDFGAEFVDLLFQVAHLSGVFVVRTIAGTLLIFAVQKTAHSFARQVGHAARARGDTNLPQSGELLFRHPDADDPRPWSQDSHIELRQGIRILELQIRLHGWGGGQMIRGG